MIKILSIVFLSFSPLFFLAQVSGVVQDLNSKESIIGAKVFASDGNKAITDYDGKFVLKCESFPVTIITKMLQYNNDTLVISSSGEVTIKLSEPITDLQTVVVSAGRRKQAIEDVTVSMEIIRPELIDNKESRAWIKLLNKPQGCLPSMGKLVFAVEVGSLMEQEAGFYCCGMECLYSQVTQEIRNGMQFQWSKQLKLKS